MTEPNDETQPHPTEPPASEEAAAGSTAADEPAAGSDSGSPSPAEPPHKTDPDGPADSGWREPPWFPPRNRDRRPSLFAVIVGLALIAVGVYYFLERTLGVTLPRIQWSTVWPIVLIVVGAVVLLRSFQRKA
jgi:hypothetical protein